GGRWRDDRRRYVPVDACDLRVGTDVCPGGYARRWRRHDRLVPSVLKEIVMLVRGLSWLVFLVAISSSGCKNPHYCEGNPNDDCRAAWDSGPGVDAFTCTSSTECAAPTPVCDTTTGTCVQCLAPDDTAACTGTTPVCDDNHTCRACEAHSECPSQACLPDGSCAQASDVAYVSAAGTGTACTQGSPCPLLADAIAKDLPYVKIAADGAAVASATTVIDGKAVTILAEPGASIDRQTDGA